MNCETQNIQNLFMFHEATIWQLKGISKYRLYE